MAVVVRAPQSIAIAELCPSIFLAGSIDMGAAEDWQEVVTQALADIDGIAIMNPRRDSFDTSEPSDMWNVALQQQRRWEAQALAAASVCFFYFGATTKAPISLLELGIAFGRRAPIIVNCPHKYWRSGNVVLECADRDIPVYETLGEAVAAARAVLLQQQEIRSRAKLAFRAGRPADEICAEEDAKIMQSLREAANGQ